MKKSSWIDKLRKDNDFPMYCATAGALISIVLGVIVFFMIDPDMVLWPLGIVGIGFGYALGIFLKIHD